MEFFIQKTYAVVLLTVLDFPSGNSQGDRCSYLLDCVAWFLCSTSFLTYRLSGWTLQWVGCSQIGSLGSIPLCWRREIHLSSWEMLWVGNPTLMLKVSTRFVFIHMSPFHLLMKQSPPFVTQWDTSPGDGNLLASAALDLGLGSWLLTKCLMLAASPRQTLPVSVPSQNLNESLQECVACQEEPEVYTSYLTAKQCTLYFTLFC